MAAGTLLSLGFPPVADREHTSHSLLNGLTCLRVAPPTVLSLNPCLIAVVVFFFIINLPHTQPYSLPAAADNPSHTHPWETHPYTHAAGKTQR